MGQDLKSAVPKIAVAEIVRYGDKLIVPDGMSLGTARDLLARRMEFEETVMQISETFEVFPWDGAYALQIVLEQKYGWAQGVTVPGSLFSPDKPPAQITIEVGYGEFKQISWGRFALPTGGWVETGTTFKDGRLCFRLAGEIRRKSEPGVRQLFEEVRDQLHKHSLYRGKAVKVVFFDDDGDRLPIPTLRFIDTEGIDPSQAIYPSDVQRMINTNLYTPIVRSRDCLANGITLKRGVLLAGTYGTGKTLASLVAAKLAVDNGITFIHCARSNEIADAITFARTYQSPAAVVFCEDIDRTTSGERTLRMDEILNIIDGIDSKTQNILCVLTTNDVDSINPALLRPGRLDAVIEILPPDAEAVEKLIRLYAGDAVEKTTALSEVSKMLEGNIPATIAEVVRRAKLAQLSTQRPGTLVKQLTNDALIDAAKSITYQTELMERLKVPKKSGVGFSIVAHGVPIDGNSRALVEA